MIFVAVLLNAGRRPRSAAMQPRNDIRLTMVAVRLGGESF